MLEVVFCFLSVCTWMWSSADAFPTPILRLHLNQSESPSISQIERRMLSESGETARSPLFQGMGTHYSFLWVGTPAQRVSVIMDTGSHHTAFPCVGCKCGKHMDPHFDPARSSSSHVKQCGGTNQKCYFRQSYSEGSSWHAFKVSDQVYIAGDKAEDLPEARNASIPFDFGCQDSETGLFRTQQVDGIMGLSASEETLPYQLYAQHRTTSRTFALCFRVGGGVLTLGGVDPVLHQHYLHPHHLGTAATATGAGAGGGTQRRVASKGASEETASTKRVARASEVVYAQLLKTKGWFTVQIHDILLLPGRTSHDNNDSETQRNNDKGRRSVRSNSNSHSHSHSDGAEDYVVTSKKTVTGAISIGGPIFKCNAGKGTIVDSGTTDTYLPQALHSAFTSSFRRLSGGLAYKHNEAVTLTPAQLHALPSIVFRLQRARTEGDAGENDTIDVVVHPTSYMERHSSGNAHRYVPRVYLTEASGAVLGANVMNEHNVIFDIDQRRVGFAASHCRYEDVVALSSTSAADNGDGPGGHSRSEKSPDPLHSSLKSSSSGAGSSVPGGGNGSNNIRGAASDTSSSPASASKSNNKATSLKSNGLFGFSFFF